jgi:hypothetical protein
LAWDEKSGPSPYHPCRGKKCLIGSLTKVHLKNETRTARKYYLCLREKIKFMGAVEIRTELQRMIEQETDVTVLEAIRTLLLKTSIDPALREKMTARALKSEEDIASGRAFSKDEVIQRTSR